MSADTRLLVPDEDVVDRVLGEDVVEGYSGATGIAPDGTHPSFTTTPQLIREPLGRLGTRWSSRRDAGFSIAIVIATLLLLRVYR